jgi:hypothetical protein
MIGPVLTMTSTGKLRNSLWTIYPELQRIVVVTDGDDFPLERFQSLVKDVTYTSEVNRSKYNVNHLRNESIDNMVTRVA